ncbi:alpha-amylase family protein [Rarobacter incanus]|uniref:Glycosidase n=1 Tax=Rarobacter incanus TaxID=153494 RepID=A0A542SL57_9MICO|nr:alpha-amylase family protein [Rarobacter incanus]TQK75379.1 glycosidase [Rarobacter incanus]
MHSDTGWTDHVIWWQLYPLGFCGAPIRVPDQGPGPHHRLARIDAWLDYAVELGASGLLLGPVFSSQSHGYDTTDHFAIDARLGDEEDFARLVSCCRARGLRVVLDGVFSHVGDRHPLFLQALAAGRNSPAAQLFDIDWDAPGGPRAAVFEGHGSLVRLNHESARTIDFVVSVMNYWLDRGADGWRLDAAYSVPVSFWARALARVRVAHPRAWFLGEVIHGDYAAFIAGSGADSLTQYELWKAVWSSLLERNLFELDWTLGRHNEFLETFVPQTFVGNHDVTRIASRIGQSRAVLAAAILFTVGGVPSLYAGDEQGFTGLKQEREGGDDDIRPPFPQSPAQLSDLGARTHRAYQDLIAIRRRNPWLHTARTQTTELTNTTIVYRSRAAQATENRWIETSIDATGEGAASIRDHCGAVLWRWPK